MTASSNGFLEGHSRLKARVEALADSELTTLRRTNWGEMKETRWIIAVMIEHDLYHAEINHIRALYEGSDKWAWWAGHETRLRDKGAGKANSDGIFPEGSIRVIRSPQQQTADRPNRPRS